MVWMVIGIPLTSVIMGVVMITLAFHDRDGLVVDDYYKEGLEINRTLERDALAGKLGLTAEVRLDTAGKRLSLSLSGNPAFRAPDRIKLAFYHATRADRDRVISLQRDATGVYSAPLPELRAGRWYVSAETPEWRLIREVWLPGKNDFTITAQAPAAGGTAPGT